MTMMLYGWDAKQEGGMSYDVPFPGESIVLGMTRDK